ncbi:response regulator receiver domain protein (CheY-like) [gamma proteobacterium IMCC1989]|nr:response regulator receiver domain protein (CheY-like) [gamma proteobacterium IMCC1989]
MAQEDTRWRDKYRHSLTQQEQLEKTLTAQQALLHRTVVALCSAAEGQDSEVDKRLSAIRSSLKSNDVGGFDRMIKSLEKVIIDADKKRHRQWEDVHKHFLSIANQLQKLSSSSNTKSAVKDYKKRIPKGELLPSTLKRLLEEFSHIQNQVKIGSENNDSKNGLISRLFNKEKSSDDTNERDNEKWEEVEESANVIAQNTQEKNTPAEEIEGEIIHNSDEHETRYRERTIPEAIHQRPSHEPAFSKISDRVTIILTELLDHFPSVECVEQKALKVRQNINRGLNWYELAPTLEDIRDFVIQSSIGADDNYRLYLNNVYQELSHITHSLGLAIQEEEEQRLASDKLHSSVDDGIQTINQALSEHNDIDRLKTAVEAQVHNIQSALKDSLPAKNNDQESLSNQLTSLVERVQKMEKQDADIREQLEQEKIRAVTDKLTGLPNREAYSERVHDEMLRWQRYQHPLSLAVLDIDFFKKVNDQYGHQMGDKVLKAVSSSVANRLREVDFIARFGGEEFVLLLPETSAEDALHMLNRTRERLAKTQMKSKNSDGEETKFTVTFSIGIAQFTDGDTADDVFERADKALYEAKENGRNQCVIG